MIIVYKTTNTINGKIYVGIHKQKDEKFDGYYGSGLLLYTAIKKYGIENFMRETISICSTWNDARLLEKSIVTEEFCKRTSNYNISVGGIGGNTLAGKSIAEKKDIKRRAVEKFKITVNERMVGDRLFQYQERMKAIRIQPDNKNRKHTKKSKENIKNGSHMRGATWITNGKENRVMHDNEHLSDDWCPGRTVLWDIIPLTTETIQKRSAKLIGRDWYNNGERNIKLAIGSEAPEGFVKGMLYKRKNKEIWITDGITSTRVLATVAIPEGWGKGRIMRRKKDE